MNAHPCVYLHQHFGGSIGYGHKEAGGREALDQAFAEIFGAESAIVRALVCHFLLLFLCLTGIMHLFNLLLFNTRFSQVLMQSPVLYLLS